MIVITSDYHLSGSEGDSNVALSKIEQFVAKEKPEFFVMCGDTFDSRHPPVAAQIVAAKHYLNISKTCHTFILSGNHDAGTRANALEPFKILSGKKMNVIMSPTRVESAGLDFIFFPWIYGSGRGKNNRLEKQINSLMTSLIGAGDKPKLLFAHATPFGSKLGKLDTIITGDVIIKQNSWKRFSNSFFGHIHARQELPERAFVVGSIERFNFGDKDDDKGFYTYDNGKIEFHSIGPRRMVEVCGTVDEVMSTINNIEESAKVKIVFHLEYGETPPKIEKKFNKLVVVVKRKRTTQRKETNIEGFNFWRVVEQYVREKGYSTEIIEYARSL